MDFDAISLYLKKTIRGAPLIERFEEEKKWLISQMENTIETGESTSALIVDLTKSSTTHIVEEAVHEINSDLNGCYTIIQLYGRLHSESDNAFHEIVANLSEDCSPDIEIMGAIGDKVDYVLKCIRDENENKPVIFIFDEFHMFCEEGENTLIYPMIDALHSKVPICVIGVTADQTCIQKLGKRVTSRFSGKIVFLESKGITERNFLTFQSLLSLDPCYFSKNIVDEWNCNVLNLSEDSAVSKMIKHLSQIRFSEEEFRQVLFVIASNFGVRRKLLSSEEVIECIESFLPQDYSKILNNLSATELCLVIAIQHHMDVLNEPVFNFTAIFHRYNKVKSRTHQMPQITEQLGKKAFENLMKLGLIKAVQSATSELIEYIPFRFRLDPYAVKSCIESGSNVPDILKQWSKNPLLCH